MIEKFPDKPWGWDTLSHHPNITMDFIEKYANKHWI